MTTESGASKTSQPGGGNLENKLNGGKLRTKFYINLRLHLKALYEAVQALKDKELSERQLALQLGLPQASFRKLRKFVVLHGDEIDQAAQTSDWLMIENRLFLEHGNYKLLPSYKEAIAIIENGGPQKIPLAKIKGKPGRKPGSKNKPKPKVTLATPETPAATGGPIAPAPPARTAPQKNPLPDGKRSYEPPPSLTSASAPKYVKSQSL